MAVFFKLIWGFCLFINEAYTYAENNFSFETDAMHSSQQLHLYFLKLSFLCMYVRVKTQFFLKFYIIKIRFLITRLPRKG